MTAARRLPGGRGIAVGDGAFREQGESFEGRLAALPLPAQPWACVANPWIFGDVATYTANRLHLYAMPVSTYDAVVDQARVINTVAAAGSTIRTALYTVDFSTNAFTMVAGSAAEMNGGALGSLNTTLSRPVRLVANKPYFIGLKVSSSTPSLASLPAGMLNTLYVNGSAGPMVQNVGLSALTKSVNLPVPGVVYLNRIWRDYI